MVGVVVYGSSGTARVWSPCWIVSLIYFVSCVLGYLFEYRDNLRLGMMLSSSYEDFKFLLEGLGGSRI